MKLKVSQLMEMIKSGELKTEHSTQRQFLYGSTACILETGETTTKAGSVIHSMLELNIQLPAIYFFHNTDTNTTNVHDGKQRLLSIYYFINPCYNHITTAKLFDRDYSNADSLPEELREKLLNYEFDIVERSGTTREEELSFKLINTCGLPLTDYEVLAGMQFGTFITQFENYINNLSKRMDSIKDIGRGAQAYSILLVCFDIRDDHSCASKSRTFNKLNEQLKAVRNLPFNAADWKLDKILNLYNNLTKILKKVKEEKLLFISNYVIRNNFDENKVTDAFTALMREENDIGRWDDNTIRTYINTLIQKNMRLYSKRFFTPDVKDELYRQFGRCQHINEDGTQCNVTNYSALEVDHKIPWSEGGQTNIMNAQLLCKAHNTSKGKKLK